MLSPEFVNGKDLRTQIGALNGTGFMESKIKTVGVQKAVMVKSFIDGFASIPEEKDKEIPESVILFYNSIVEGQDPSAEEQEAAKKKKAPKREGPSREGKMYELVKAGTTDAAIEKEFIAYYTKKGVTDADFVKKRIAIYKNIAKKKIAKETGVTEEPDKTAEKTAEETADTKEEVPAT